MFIDSAIAHRYDVQVLETHFGTHLMIRQRNGNCIQVGWSSLQRIKELYCPGRTMVEFYPAPEDVVDEVNIRHLWAWPADWQLPLYPRK